METKSVLDCRPCHMPTCRLGHHRCMRDIDPDEVFAATRRALAAIATVG
jgi:heptosyltransferase-2